MSFFIKEVDGDLVLQTGGYIVAAVILAVLILIAGLLLSKRGERKKMSAKQLAFCAVALALAMVTSMIKIFRFPFGGSVTLFSMLFICLIGYFYGPGTGILTAVAYGVLQFILGPYIYTPIQVVVDYPLAFGALGLAGLFWKSKNGLLKGYIIGVVGRWVFSVISGWVFFGEYAWDGWAALPYSLCYNGAYIYAEAIITIILISIPPVKKAINYVKNMALA
ncbi:MAG: energy-coupled thiamine transporter ThiT [Lachnospiraceae bacterium]|nr:energy-coupled thiamine transporter ThiT [Lachnospiraceae bacterium]